MTDRTLKIIRHVTWIGFWVNALLMAIKLVVGYTGHSDALVADGYHSLSDFATDLIVLFFAGIAYKSADKEHPFGHGKYETFATLLIVVILFGVGVALGYGGVRTIIAFHNGEEIPVPDIWTIVVAAVSIASKEWLFQYTRREGDRIGSTSLKANAWHHRSDAISSVATLIGVSLAYFLGSKWTLADPVACIIIAVFIMWSAVSMVKDPMNELLDISLTDEELLKAEEAIRSVPGVKSFHKLLTRRNGQTLIFDLHVKVDGNLTVRDGHEIATNVEKAIREAFGPNTIITVHIEPK